MEAAARTGRLPDLVKFEILEELGHGGMATVYRARDRRLGRDVALKVIHPHLRDSADVAARFHAEAKAVAMLRHPNIVEVYDVSEADEAEQYIVVELVRGTTLRRLEQKFGPLPPEVAAAIVVELLDALAHAHGSGVVHRDVKPENVLIDHPPPSESPDSGEIRVRVKLTDFGIAKLLDAQGVTSTGQVLGSPAHMAPEQIEGGEVDARADLFGLGVLLYECMVGHLPFQGNNPAQVLRRVLDGAYPPAEVERPTIGSRWSALVDRALAHSPADRFADASHMRAAIVEELDRLGYTTPMRELSSWLSDPESYRASYERNIVERLCVQADRARRSRNALLAASDYNRALAHRPDDPRLLRIVAGIHRSAAWARWSRRASAVTAGLLAAGGVVAVVARPTVRLDATRTVAHPASAAAAVPSEAFSIASALAPPSRADAMAAPVGSSSVPAAPRRPTPILRPRETITVRPPADRAVSLDLKPAMGVAVAVDDQPLFPVSTGDRLSLDGGAHVLSFSCPVCTPVQLTLASGDKDETIAVSVPVKPATLVVDGNAARTYQVIEHPELSVRVGANTIGVKSAFEHVTVREMETGRTVSVRLAAGSAMHASFE